MNPLLPIRPMQAADVPGMLAVQAQCYPLHMNEPAEVLLARWQACPDTAWVACDVHGHVQAYLVGYWSRWGKVSPLGQAFAHSHDPEVLYLHDLAIGRTCRGQGAAQALLAVAQQACVDRGMQGITLVSVNGSQPFWQRLGWDAVTLDAIGQQALLTYADDAVCMARIRSAGPLGA
jgi:ribosomal protein S18 acetylase RimI-like enzyme